MTDLYRIIAEMRDYSAGPDCDSRIIDGWADRLAALAGAAPVCTCPSGTGSFRWPCPAHPPIAATPAAPVVDAVLVPRQMNDEMEIAFWWHAEIGDDGWVDLGSAWAAMLAAAPTTPHAPAKAREDWQPIATAPKGAPWWLVWSSLYQMPVVVTQRMDDGTYWDGDWDRDVQANHWFPLSAPAALATFAEGE